MFAGGSTTTKILMSPSFLAFLLDLVLSSITAVAGRDTAVGVAFCSLGLGWATATSGDSSIGCDVSESGSMLVLRRAMVDLREGGRQRRSAHGWIIVHCETGDRDAIRGGKGARG